MTTTKLGRVFAVLLTSMFVFACSSTQTTSGEGETQTDTNTQVTPVETEAERAAREAREAAERAAAESARVRQARIVYFEFDDSTVQTSAQALLRAHAEFLSKNPGVQVVVEGHCDERGTPEYNLALGERRGKSVKDVLVSYGVLSSQIRVVSYGEEKPANPAHNESAWEKNRRAVLVYEG